MCTIVITWYVVATFESDLQGRAPQVKSPNSASLATVQLQRLLPPTTARPRCCSSPSCCFQAALQSSQITLC